MPSVGRLSVAILLCFCVFLFEGRSASALSEETRRFIVDFHNRLRFQLAEGQVASANGMKLPPGQNIYKMQYSTQLETDMQAWLEKCDLHYSSPTKRCNVGENMYQIRQTEQEMEENSTLAIAMSAWWSELNHFTHRNPMFTLDDYCNNEVGRFTQMAWSNSLYVGCSVNFCSTQKVILVGCRYLNAGNKAGAPIYDVGYPCSGCSMCDSHGGLCITTLVNPMEELGYHKCGSQFHNQLVGLSEHCFNRIQQKRMVKAVLPVEEVGSRKYDRPSDTENNVLIKSGFNKVSGGKRLHCNCQCDEMGDVPVE